MVDCLRWLTAEEVEEMNGFVHTHVPQGAGEQRNADDAFFIHGRMRKGSTFSLQLLSGINHGFGSNIKIFGSLGTITLSNDEKLCFGKVNEQLEAINVLQRQGPLHLTKEANAYYPAFYPFLEKVYDYIVYNKIDEDLPTILDGHENQLLIDKVRFN